MARFVARDRVAVAATLVSAARRGHGVVGRGPAVDRDRDRATTYRGAPLERYLRLQDEVSPAGSPGGPSSSTASRAGGTADDLGIRGDCEALYVNTGDANEAWLLVEERSRG